MLQEKITTAISADGDEAGGTGGVVPSSDPVQDPAAADVVQRGLAQLSVGAGWDGGSSCSAVMGIPARAQA